MRRTYPWNLIAIGLLLCGFWFNACSQQEGPAEKAGKKIDQAIDDVAGTMEETKENVVDAAKDAMEDMKEATQKE